jgi:ubiquinone/menaquinone biosynthesis C-methylase UbiE
MKNIYSQFGNPNGFLGEIIGWILALNNGQRNFLALEKLNPVPNDEILEIGFGPGVTVNQIVKNYKNIFVSGIDISDVMIKQAVSRNKDFIEEQKVILKKASVENIPFDDNYFDKILGSNVSLFFPSPIENFKEIKRVLKPGGILLNVLQPRSAKNKFEVEKKAEELISQITKAGFKNINLEIVEMKPVDCIYINCEK